MAPSITETVSLRTAPAKPLRTEGGHNKEFAGLKNTYNHEHETKGTANKAPASFPHYLPVWDNESEKYISLRSTSHLRGFTN